MTKPREWTVNNDMPYEETVGGPPTKGDVEVIEKSGYDRVVKALKRAYKPHPDDEHIFGLSGKTVNQKMTEKTLEELGEA